MKVSELTPAYVGGWLGYAAEGEELTAGQTAELTAALAAAKAFALGFTGLTEEELDVVAHFKNPAMPSVASTSDAAVKIASAREGFGSTDVYLEMVGFDQADIRRIKAQELRARGLQVLSEVEENENIS